MSTGTSRHPLPPSNAAGFDDARPMHAFPAVYSAKLDERDQAHSTRIHKQMVLDTVGRPDSGLSILRPIAAT